MKKHLFVILLCLFVFTSGAEETDTAPVYTETGYASWYGGKFQGRQTASGEIFDTHKLTAAHKTLPFGTIVRVTNLDNGKEVKVRINDRGPFIEGRIIDLSMAAAQKIGLLGTGVGRVKIEVAEEDSASSKVRYSIQVASFQDKENAHNLRDTLLSKGFEPQLESSESGLFRVILPLMDEADLKNAIGELSDIGHSSVLVRQHFAPVEN